jgi:hypothetical protein
MREDGDDDDAEDGCGDDDDEYFRMTRTAISEKYLSA